MATPRQAGMLKKERQKTMSKSLVQFFRETRQESAKVTWPNRKETVTTTVVVFIMIFVMAMILLVTDGVIAAGVKFILELGA